MSDGAHALAGMIAGLPVPAERAARRLAAARDEMRHYGFFDYLIINDDFDQAAATLSAIVVAERARRRRLAQVAERLLRS